MQTFTLTVPFTGAGGESVIPAFEEWADSFPQDLPPLSDEAVSRASIYGPNVPQPRRAASMAAMSILFICIIASNARLAAARSESVTALVRAIGVICQDRPHLSLHQPHALS